MRCGPTITTLMPGHREDHTAINRGQSLKMCTIKHEGTRMRSAAHWQSLTGCYDSVVIGGSAGGIQACSAILAALPPGFAMPVLLVQHLHPGEKGAFSRHMGSVARLPVIEAGDKDLIEPGRVYIAPADYHMRIAMDRTISLSREEKVHRSRPSIDVLFESAALVLGKKVIAVILSGASADGTAGLQAIKAAGGLTLAQDPAMAEFPLMPRTAINTGAVDEVLTTEEIGQRLLALGRKKYYEEKAAALLSRKNRLPDAASRLTTVKAVPAP
jgi:two-component system chemotaxis response regulator CheB